MSGINIADDPNDPLPSPPISRGQGQISNNIGNDTGNENEQLRQFLASLDPGVQAALLEDLQGRVGQKQQHSAHFNQINDNIHKQYAQIQDTSDYDHFTQQQHGNYFIPSTLNAPPPRNAPKTSAIFKSAGPGKLQTVSLPNISENGAYKPEVYDALINILLNAKKDIKLSHAAETRAGAIKWGKSRGLRIGPK